MKLSKISVIGSASLSLFAIFGVSGSATAQERPPHFTTVQMQERLMPEIIVEERGAPPAANWHWVKGYWRWDRDRWDWQKGHWVASAVPPMPEIIVERRPPPPGPTHFWVPGHWVWKPQINNWT